MMGLGEVARKGRPRKFGTRYASGDLVPEKKPDDRIRTSRQPHRRQVPAADRMSEKAESELGRMLLRGLLADNPRAPVRDRDLERERSRCEAGERYAVIVGQYRAVIEAPRATSGAGRGFDCAPDLCRAYPAECECLVRRRRYDGAFEAVAGLPGQPHRRRIAWAVAQVAVFDRAIQAQDIPYLISGLDALDRHFCLTKPKM